MNENDVPKEESVLPLVRGLKVTQARRSRLYESLNTTVLNTILPVAFNFSISSG